MIQEVRADMRKHIGEWRMTQLDGATRKTPFTPLCERPSPSNAPVIQSVEAILLAQIPWDPDHQVRRLHHHCGPKQHEGEVLHQEHVHQITIPPLILCGASACRGQTGWAQVALQPVVSAPRPTTTTTTAPLLCR